jgi:hypothetical protein
VVHQAPVANYQNIEALRSTVDTNNVDHTDNNHNDNNDVDSKSNNNDNDSDDDDNDNDDDHNDDDHNDEASERLLRAPSPSVRRASAPATPEPSSFADSLRRSYSPDRSRNAL